MCVFFKARGGAAMALNVLGKFKVMWVGKFLESSRVWVWIKFVEISGVCGRGKFGGMWAWEVRGKFEGVGCGRGKFAESSRVRVLKVLGKFEG